MQKVVMSYAHIAKADQQPPSTTRTHTAFSLLKSMTKPGSFCWQSPALWAEVATVAMMWQRSLSEPRWLKKNRRLPLTVSCCVGATTLVTNCELYPIMCVILQSLPVVWMLRSFSHLTEPIRDNSVLCYDHNNNHRGKLNIRKFLLLIFRSM